MNITDLIVELLQQGQKVELPGIGTFDSVTQSPRHDAATRIYYPATRNIVFSDSTTGDNSIVKTIAGRECVGDDVAQQMWNNYIDALQDKMNRTGEHQFGNLGTLSKSGSGFAFNMTEGVVIEAGSTNEKPLEEVKTYDHSNSDDPFAQFDADMPAVTVVQKPEPKPMPEPEPEPEVDEDDDQEEEEETLVDDTWQESLKKLDELPKSKAALKAEAKAEKARLKAEAKAEKERAKMRKRAQKDHDNAERQAEESREAAERREAEERRRAEEELRNAEERAEAERIRAEKEAEAALLRAERKVEEDRKKAEKRAAALAAVAASQAAKGQPTVDPMAPVVGSEITELKEAQQESQREHERLIASKQKEIEKAEKEAAKEAERRLKEEKKLEKAAKKEAKRQAKAAGKEPQAMNSEATTDKEEKKRSKGWLWLLLLLLLLLAGIAAFLFLKGRSTGNHAVLDDLNRPSKHLNLSKLNQFSFNTDLLVYNDRDMSRNSDKVCANMADYINNFLAENDYPSARVPMMDRVRQYSDERMQELMGNRMAVQRFIPYEDYIYQSVEPWLRGKYPVDVRNTVQGELMDAELLEGMLQDVVDEYGLTPGGERSAAAQPTAPAETAKPAAAPQKKTALPDDDPVYVYVEKKSKQGFDIIAGFYLNKGTAAKMTARLHELGSDAYIIEKNEMFYVSMGSAPTRTKAEALYNHIKGWYDGDIVIKQLD